MIKKVRFEKLAETNSIFVGVLHFVGFQTEILLPKDPELLEEIAELIHDLADKEARKI